MVYSHSRGRDLGTQVLVVLGITLLALILGAILLPPKSSSARPRDGAGESMSPR